MTDNSRIDLLLPGLFGPIPVVPEDLQQLQALARLLGRATRAPARGSDPIAVLFDLFGLSTDPDQDLPSAPFSRLAHLQESASQGDSTGYWLHADPIHLHPDRDRLLVFDARHLGLEQKEANSLIAVANDLIAQDDLRLECPATEHWYLRLDTPPRLTTSALPHLVGQTLERDSLRGEDAPQWMRWLNELQMLFHQSDVNRQRERAGRPTVSGIWPWGGGRLPARMPPSPYGSVFAEHPLACGLAKAARIQTHPIPDHPGELPAGQAEPAMLLFWDSLWLAVLDQEPLAWAREMTRVAHWLDTLVGRLGTGKLGELRLLPCDGTCFVVTRRTLKRFWKRPMDIAARFREPPRKGSGLPIK